MCGLALAAPRQYRALLQEDRFIEWWTVFLFLGAAVFGFRSGRAQRHIADLLIAAFCLFVAGEEFSWGQRLVGYTPPPVFLEHNTQQELTLHNFSSVFGQPKVVLMLALFGFGVLLPAIALRPRGAGLLEKVGATAPPLALTPWFLAAVALLYWYPFDFTGEWVEALAGGLFLTSARLQPRRLLGATSFAALAAAGLTLFSAQSSRAAQPAALECARLEVAALLNDVRTSAAAPRLINGSGGVHKRIWTAIDDRYLYRDRFPSFAVLGCSSSPREFMVDPWGIAYWIRVRTRNGVREVQVYSMGPNRRRDHTEAVGTAGDDLIGAGVLSR
jgi:hypothetical protein